MAFPPGFLDELRARLSLSDVVGRKVALKRRSGSEYAGLCPFHNEKTPSFTVNDKKGFFYCFGCHEKGDVVGFTMKTEGLSFPEAVEKLARDAGLEVPRATPQERERAVQASSLQQVVELAARWFQKQLRLPAGRQGLDYLRGRGLEDDTIDDFRLGFAPDSRDGVIAALKREGVPLDKIVEAGLAIQPEDAGREAYDRFRGRVIFPINDRRGRVIAFGGRVMGTGEPKYLNSPETPLFHKGANLYCLDRARQATTKNQPVIVAEGYMDVIALHGAGFTGAVAPLGTALTEGQLGEIWKLADEPYLCFDGDKAGQRAAHRGAARALPLLRPGKSLRFVVLPQGEDPDSLIRTRGVEAIQSVLKLARPLADVVWDIETEGKPVDTPERRASIEEAIKKRVREIADPIVQEQYRKEMRDRLYKAHRADRPAWQPGPKRAFRRPNDPPPAPFPSGTAARQAGTDLDGSRQIRILLGALIERPAMLHVVSEDAGRLEIDNPTLDKLRTGILDAQSQFPAGLDPAAEAGLEDAVSEGLETRLILDYLQRAGLASAAEAARTAARTVFRDPPGDGQAWMDRWQRMEGYISRKRSNAEDLERMRLAAEQDLTDQNLGQFEEMRVRVNREDTETPVD